MSQPQYIGEVAPTHLRGRLVGLYGACFQLGSVFVSIIEPSVNDFADGTTDVGWVDWLGYHDEQLELEDSSVRQPKQMPQKVE